MKILATIVANVLSIGAHAEPQAKQIVGSDWFGCADVTHFEKIAWYAVDADDRTFAQELGYALRTGECVFFREGEDVFITRMTALSGLVKIHRRGDLNEFWTHVEAVGY